MRRSSPVICVVNRSVCPGASPPGHKRAPRHPSRGTVPALCRDVRLGSGIPSVNRCQPVYLRAIACSSVSNSTGKRSIRSVVDLEGCTPETI